MSKDAFGILDAFGLSDGDDDSSSEEHVSVIVSE